MNKNYLIGNAEVLTSPVERPISGGPKNHPYTYQESRIRLQEQLAEALEESNRLSLETGLEDLEVLKFTLHPEYIAKSYYPSTLMRNIGLESVGSRSVERQGGDDVRNYENKSFSTSEIFVAGHRDSYLEFLKKLRNDNEDKDISDIIKIQNISYFSPEDKIKGYNSESDSYEVVLHVPSEDLAPGSKSKFLHYVKALGGEVKDELSFNTERLWFVPVTIPGSRVHDLAAFNTLRVIRPMPKVGLSPLRGVNTPHRVNLPEVPENITGPNVAIFDGGLPENSFLRNWVTKYIETDSSATGIREFEEHGHAVCSAFLFGSLAPGASITAPNAKVHMFRVLDSKSKTDDLSELYTVLGYIEEALLSGLYHFANLSLGPNLPVEDDEVHAWTSVLDRLLEDGQTMLTVAVGNNGDADVLSGNARIQVPGDAVNALAVGSANRTTTNWERASYSARGPGRFPGRIKPDVLAFGGSPEEFFYVLSPNSSSAIEPQMGTSLASPAALRQGVLIKNMFEEQLSPLAIKALLIHASETKDIENKNEHGWGRIPQNIDRIISGEAGTARIVYQGSLLPGKYVRAQIPLPHKTLSGNVRISATFCFATPTDPESPDVYTRSGLDIVFRPKCAENELKPGQSDTFFSKSEYCGEEVQRKEAGKWENVLHAGKTKRGSSLDRPVFDIHYNARIGGRISSSQEKMPYALVITIEAARHVDLHDEILANFPELEAFEPSIPVTADVDIVQGSE